MLCIDDKRAVALFERQLSPEESACIEAHVDGCDPCRRLVATIARLWSEPPSGDDAGAVAWWGACADLVDGTRLGRYVVSKRLGAGAMGVVYAAYDPDLDRNVAIKLLRPSLLDSEHAELARHRLAREAKAMARIAHANVVSVYDVGSFEERVFFAMELVDGTTLRRWLDDEPRDADEVLAVFLQAGAGLAAAHAAGIVHRDFKPDNVLIGASGRVAVTDFGLARRASLATPPAETSARNAVDRASSDAPTLTKTGSVMGTPAYMAPEQRSGREADAKSDQYSFCVALDEALRGLPSSVRARRARSALERGLREAPEERYPSMDALLLALVPRRTALSTYAVVAGIAGLAIALVAREVGVDAPPTIAREAGRGSAAIASAAPTVTTPLRVGGTVPLEPAATARPPSPPEPAAPPRRVEVTRKVAVEPAPARSAAGVRSRSNEDL